MVINKNIVKILISRKIPKNRKKRKKRKILKGLLNFDLIFIGIKIMLIFIFINEINLNEKYFFHYFYCFAK